MKKSISYLLSAALGLGLFMSVPVFADEAKTSALDELTDTYGSDIESLDYTVSSKTADNQNTANFVDGLLETDNYGHLKPAIAASYEKNEDASVWTFKLRDDVKWVTADGEEYDTVKAEDFVTGIRHGAEFNSELAPLLEGVLKGYSEFRSSDFSDEAWEKVGVKAKDDTTVEFTLEKPVPYFDTMALYTVLYPVNRAFLESKGEGCKLGTPDREKCGFGSAEADSILYSGPFILREMTAKSKMVWEKNDAYWDSENVHLKKVTYIYDDGHDPYARIKGFEQGIYQSAALNTSWEDYSKYLEKYKDNAYFTIPNNTTFGMIFNFNRQSFEMTNYAKDEKARENTHKAILNENFRKAVRAAFDKEASLAVTSPKEVAQGSLRNINNFPGAGTKKDGTTYFQEVEKQYREMTGDKERKLEDGQDAFLSKEDAKKYIEAAEKEGVQFPVHLDMLVVETSDRLTKQAQSLKKSIADNTDNKIIVELVMKDQNTVSSIAYRNTDPAKFDYDISTFTGWGPDYGDPKSFVDTYSTTVGHYMAPIGLGLVDKDGKVLDQEIKDQVGLSEYEKLYREADKITTDNDKRYEAFAKADAKLIEKCFYIPTQMSTRGQVVSRFVPFVQMYSDYGVSGSKLKGLRLQKEIVKTADRDAAYKDWQSHR